MKIEDPIEVAEGYKVSYTNQNFWDKVTTYAKKVGKKGIEMSLTLYYTLRDKDTPMWAKGVITGALGYFIFPIDLILDITPLIGYTDDITVMVAALTTVAAHVKQEHRDRALETLKQWFG